MATFGVTDQGAAPAQAKLRTEIRQKRTAVLPDQALAQFVTGWARSLAVIARMASRGNRHVIGAVTTIHEARAVHRLTIGVARRQDATLWELRGYMGEEIQLCGRDSWGAWSRPRSASSIGPLLPYR